MWLPSESNHELSDDQDKAGTSDAATRIGATEAYFRELLGPGDAAGAAAAAPLGAPATDRELLDAARTQAAEHAVNGAGSMVEQRPAEAFTAIVARDDDEPSASSGRSSAATEEPNATVAVPAEKPDDPDRQNTITGIWAPSGEAAAPAEIGTAGAVSAAADVAGDSGAGDETGGRSHHNRLLMLAAGLLLAGALIVAAVLINHTSTATPRVRASAPLTPARSAAPPALHKSRAVRHRAVAHHKRFVRHTPAAIHTNVTAAAPVYTPPSATTGHGTTAATSSPATSNGSSGGSGAATLTQGSGGGSLPPATGPTSTVGSGK